MCGMWGFFLSGSDYLLNLEDCNEVFLVGVLVIFDIRSSTMWFLFLYGCIRFLTKHKKCGFSFSVLVIICIRVLDPMWLLLVAVLY